MDASIRRYFGVLDTASRQQSEAAELLTARLTTRLDDLRRQMRHLTAPAEAVSSLARSADLADQSGRARCTEINV